MSELKVYLAGKDRVKAVQWNSNGDHPLDHSEFVTLGTETDGEPDIVLSAGKFVQPFVHSKVPARAVCNDCGYTMQEHGWIETGDGVVVCPGDYVVTNETRDTYATKPDVFEATYRPEQL